MIKWGRKGLLLGAIAATFVTPVSQTTTVKQASVTPSHKVEVRHVTPAPTGSSIKRASVQPNNRIETRHITPTELVAGIKRYQPHPSYKIEVRHVTPTDTPIEEPENTNYGGFKRVNRDDEIIALIIAMYETGAV